MAKLYRVMCQAELDDLNSTGAFASIPGSIEGKWLAESIDDAAAWGHFFRVAREYRMI